MIVFVVCYWLDEMYVGLLVEVLIVGCGVVDVCWLNFILDGFVWDIKILVCVVLMCILFDLCGIWYCFSNGC